jgi:hypothetical protein
MPLILAVEPDPRQASRLSVVLRGRRNTAVVMAKSADTAIESMEGRVPDVVLTSQLLSPQDEQRLADWLKELGPAAQHVQALTIPILATPDKPAEPPPRGLLGGLLGRTGTPGPHGCEPKIFAEHVASYLEQGRVERTEDVVAEEPAAIPAEPALVAEEPADFAEALAAMPAEPVVTPEAMAVPETSGTLEVEIPTVIASAAYTTEAIDDGPEAGAWLLTRNLDTAAQDADAAPTAPPTPVYELPADLVPKESMDVVFLPPDVITVWDDNGSRPSHYVDRHRSDMPMIARPIQTDEPSPDLLPMAVVQASTAPPVMDEWGLFDPAKCGFSALLDKLDEITEEDRRAQTHLESSVRLITHY